MNDAVESCQCFCNERCIYHILIRRLTSPFQKVRTREDAVVVAAGGSLHTRPPDAGAAEPRPRAADASVLAPPAASRSIHHSGCSCGGSLIVRQSAGSTGGGFRRTGHGAGGHPGNWGARAGRPHRAVPAAARLWSLRDWGGCRGGGLDAGKASAKHTQPDRLAELRQPVSGPLSQRRQPAPR
jgi:hypothetical protein